MLNLSKKSKFMVFIGLILIIAILISYLHLYKEKKYWQLDAARYNRYHWTEINLMASKLDEFGFTKETVEELYPYINAKIFSSVTGLYPAFNGNSSYNFFLQTYYVQLAMDIAYNQDIKDEKLQEALDLFEDATLSLKSLTHDIIEMTENEKYEIELRKVGSDTYNNVEKMIEEYCDEYGKKISAFNHSYERTTRNVYVDKDFSENGVSINVNHLKLSTDKTIVVCTLKNQTDEIPLNHATSHIKGRVKKYTYLEGEGKAINGQTEYNLIFEPLYAESNVELFIELKSGETFTIPINLSE